MKYRLIALLLAGMLALLTACGTPSSSGAGRASHGASATPTAAGGTCQVVMQAGSPGAGYFEPNTCMTSVGSPVTFNNQSTIVMEVFMGANQKFQENRNGPAAFDVPGGITIYPNDSYVTTFPYPGTFDVTATCSTPMPDMNMTVTVTGG